MAGEAEFVSPDFLFFFVSRDKTEGAEEGEGEEGAAEQEVKVSTEV